MNHPHPATSGSNMEHSAPRQQPLRVSSAVIEAMAREILYVVFGRARGVAIVILLVLTGVAISGVTIYPGVADGRWGASLLLVPPLLCVLVVLLFGLSIVRGSRKTFAALAPVGTLVWAEVADDTITVYHQAPTAQTPTSMAKYPINTMHKFVVKPLCVRWCIQGSHSFMVAPTGAFTAADLARLQAR